MVRMETSPHAHEDELHHEEMEDGEKGASGRSDLPGAFFCYRLHHDEMLANKDELKAVNKEVCRSGEGRGRDWIMRKCGPDWRNLIRCFCVWKQLHHDEIVEPGKRGRTLGNIRLCKQYFIMMK